MFELQKVRW